MEFCTGNQLLWVLYCMQKAVDRCEQLLQELETQTTAYQVHTYVAILCMHNIHKHSNTAYMLYIWMAWYWFMVLLQVTQIL